MGKSTGFMEYKRQCPSDINPKERLQNWDEFHDVLSEKEQRLQGARCMDCGVPFCHTGIMIKGMVSGCPLHNLIPEWNDLIYRGQFKEAIKRLLKTNNFPEFTGRVCPAPCEGACTDGLHGDPVTIKYNEKCIIDKAFENGWIKPNPPLKRTDKKIAVVGSGPAGLACADELNKLGHNVTVFERADRLGGLLMYGIPNMKLDKKVIDRRISIMEQEGITFKTGVDVGNNYDSEKLVTAFDSVVLCCGATKPRDLNAEGRELNGIHFAVEYLSKNTKSLLDSNLEDSNYINSKDKDVVVIGGGDTGTDCVGTSLRHGCKSVIQLEIMPKPSKERQVNNPWPQFPKTYKVDYGQEEAAFKFGKDPREYCVMTKKFVGDENNNIKEVHTVNIKWEKNDDGRMMPVEIPGTEKIIKADIVLLALGFLGPEEKIIENLNIERTQRSNVKAEYGSFVTNNEKIFAAGDMRRGQSLVVSAIDEGRLAAKACHEYLCD